MILAVDFQGGIENAWSSVATFLPKLAAALVILVIGYFVAKIISRILDRVLERVGFDRMVERGGLRQALARSKYEPSDLLAKVVFWAVMLFVLQLAFGVFGSNPVSDLLRGLIAYLPNIFVAILIVVIAAAIAKAVTDLLSSLLAGMQGGQLLARGAGIAILAAVVGSVIVAVGGGGIRTMQRYWDRMAGKAEERGPELRQQAQASAAQAQPDQLYGDGRTAEYPSTQGVSATDLYDTGRGQGSRTRRGR